MFQVPALGMHYTEKWAEEDLIEEQQEGMSCFNTMPPSKQGVRQKTEIQTIYMYIYKLCKAVDKALFSFKKKKRIFFWFLHTNQVLFY